MKNLLLILFLLPIAAFAQDGGSSVYSLKIPSFATGIKKITAFDEKGYIVPIPNGSENQVLQIKSGVPSWQNVSTGGVSDHTQLTSLSWGLSGHTGTPTSLASFDSGGTATTTLISSFAPASGSGNYIWNGTTTQTANFNISGNGVLGGYVQGITAKLTNLTDGYIPYHISDASGMGNSPLHTDGNFIGVIGNSDIAHSVGEVLSFGHFADNYGWIQSWYGTPLYINPLGNNVIFNRDGGNVGIGYSSGTEITNNKLAVNGSGYFNTSLRVNGLSGTSTRLVGSTSDGTLTNIPTAAGYLQNDGSGNISFNYPEITSLRSTGTTAGYVSVSNGSGGVEFQPLKTINSTSIVGTGNFTLADLNVENTFTQNQIISKSIPKLIFKPTDLNTENGIEIYYSPSSSFPDLKIGYNNYNGYGYITTPSQNPRDIVVETGGTRGWNFRTDWLFETKNLASIPSAANSGFGGFFTYNNLPYFINSSGTATQLGVSGTGMTDPMTTVGDMIIRNGSNVTSRLGVGSSGQVLTVSGGVPSWQNIPSGSSQWTSDSYGINYSSNVGIGAASTSYNKLYVTGDLSSNYSTQIFNTSDTGNGLHVKTSSLGVQPIFSAETTTRGNVLSAYANGSIQMTGLSNTSQSYVLGYNPSTGYLSYFATPGGGGGSGTVTSFSSGNLSPLFTTSVSNATTTPALSFSAVAQTQNLVYASPNGSSGNPTFRKIVVGDISASGTPSSSTYLRGDGSWSTVASGGIPYPSGSGIPVVVSGSSWGTTISIPNNTTTFLRGDGTFASTGDITSVNAGTGLSGGGTSGDVTLNLANTSVSAGSYTNANITVNAQGQITSASNGTGGWNNSVQSLSGTSITWNANSGLNANLTLTGNTTITLSNLVAGQSGNIRITNASTAYTLSFSGYTYEISPSIWSTGDTVLTSGGSRTDCFSWWYDGVVVLINGTLGYK